MISRFHSSARIKKILIAALIITLIAGILVGIALKAVRNTDEPSDFGSAPEVTLPDDLAAAYDAVIEQYRTVLTVSDLDWQSNAASYMETCPLINPAYVGFYHMGMVDSLYAAYHDIDNNGTPELFIGIGDRRSAMEAGVYGFNGSEAVLISLTDTADGYQILTDGIFLQGDKGGIILTVKQISPDGFTLEDTETADLQPGVSLQDIDLSTHGGNLEMNSWRKIPLQ